ncbi:MAG: LysM peptidoglycan-binding domain-containing protein [Urechidicola sp.]|nr:LysM peptidoglycan-binding domain-containing protein [Urechidicola sp.]
MKNYTLLFLLCCTSISMYAQDSLKVALKDSHQIEIKTTDEIIVLVDNDSILSQQNELREHAEATLIDSLWLQEMYSSPLYDSIRYVMNDTELDSVELKELPTALLKERLAIIDSETPFNVEYNYSLERIIKSYLKNRREGFATLMSRAQYYFPMFEEHLDKYDIPLEIKYLAIVESALKPRAKSHVGATGLWQFMYQTGKQFDLKVSSYVDERQDPIKATEAACKYLSVLYTIFNDWDLALAAYNSGPGNVNKAIRRSGGNRNYWNIRGFLPRETAGYVPAFYATLYIFKYADEHGIVSKKAYINKFETDTIHIKKQVTFEQINKYLDVDIELLQFLNPQYKLDIIPYVKDRNYYITLPLYNVGQFTSNEKDLYAFVDAEEAKREQTLPEYIEMGDRIRYKVKSGDYLGKIAEKYGVSVSSIKRWNGLRTNNLRVGQRLSIYPRKIATTSKPKTATTKKVVKTPSGNYETYTVKSGDSLWTISQKYSKVTVQNLKEWNNIWSATSLKIGMKLKIYKI